MGEWILARVTAAATEFAATLLVGSFDQINSPKSQIIKLVVGPILIPTDT